MNDQDSMDVFKYYKTIPAGPRSRVTLGEKFTQRVWVNGDMYSYNGAEAMASLA